MDDVFGLVGHQIDNRYAIERVVAAGGFGVVYRGVHTVLGSPVALKVLKIPDTLPERMHAGFIQQFVDEARILSQLQHPAIVRVTDFGVVTFLDGARAPWMVLEWIDGGTLAADLDARRGRGGRSPRECLDLLGPVLEALAVAHARGVVHRDIKPSNLMMPTPGPELPAGRRAALPQLRVLDFGIAKVIDEGDTAGSGQTRTNSTMAAYSPRYASPEQLGQTRTGPWTDVHALGLILTEMLVDAAPYRGSEKMELQLQVMDRERPTPARFGIDVGPWERVIAKALSLRPAERYANAGELLAALEAEVTEATRMVQVAHTEPVLGLASTSAQEVPFEHVPSISQSSALSPAPSPRPRRNVSYESTPSTLQPSAVPLAPQSRPRRTPLVALFVVIALLATCAGYLAVRPRGTNPTQPPSPSGVPPVASMRAAPAPPTTASDAAPAQAVVPLAPPTTPPVPPDAVAQTLQPDAHPSPAFAPRPNRVPGARPAALPVRPTHRPTHTTNDRLNPWE